MYLQLDGQCALILNNWFVNGKSQALRSLWHSYVVLWQRWCYHSHQFWTFEWTMHVYGATRAIYLTCVTRNIYIYIYIYIHIYWIKYIVTLHNNFLREIYLYVYAHSWIGNWVNIFVPHLISWQTGNCVPKHIHCLFSRPVLMGLLTSPLSKNPMPSPGTRLLRFLTRQI